MASAARTKNSPKTTTPKAEPIALERWDFSSCPEDERDYCRYYEFACHDEPLKAEVAARRASGAWSSGLSPADWQYYELRSKLTFFRLFTEFPDTPWLKIPRKERSKRCVECRLLDGPFLIVSPERIDQDETYPYSPSDVGNFTVHSVFAAEIDWSYSKTAIVESFKRWLDSAHPNGEMVVENRGGVEDADLLKVLGAYRLLKHFGDWEKARQWSMEKSKDGKPVYVGQSEWIKARRKAEQFVSHGVAPSAKASLMSRLDMKALSRQERVAMKVHVSMNVDRQEARRLNQLAADELLAKLRAAISLAHKNSV